MYYSPRFFYRKNLTFLEIGLKTVLLKGQLIALQAFVPTIIREKLGVLHDDMPPMSPTLSKEIIERELHKLGHSLAVFSNIDFTNVLGSASIAQVHSGVLANGKRVAVKVQYPNIEPMMMSDLANFALLGAILEKTELKVDLTRVVQELKKQIAMEFDFQAEARGMDEIKHALRGIKSITVPQSVPGMVSRRLLVMDYVNGTPMTQLETLLGSLSRRRVKFVGRKIMEHLSTSYGKMILSDGFFQADCTLLLMCDDADDAYEFYLTYSNVFSLFCGAST